MVSRRIYSARPEPRPSGHRGRDPGRRSHHPRAPSAQGPPLSNPRATRDYLRLRLAVQDHEIFAILFLDNRPSGVAEPSQADEIITNRIRDALALVDVRVLDHPVVTGDAIVSLAERGLL